MNKRMKTIRAGLIAVLMGSWLVPTLAGAGEVSFADAWNQVQARHDGLAADRVGIAKAEYHRQEARRLYYPQVDLRAQYTRLDQPVELGPDELLASMPAGTALGGLVAGLGRTYGLTPTQVETGLTSRIADRDLRTGFITGLWPVYAGGRIDAVQEIAAARHEEAQRQFDLHRSRRFEQLSQVYYGVVLAQQVLQTRTGAREGLGRHRDHAVLLEQRGQIARVERLQAEAALDKARVDETRARHDLEIAGVALTRMLKSGEGVLPVSPLFINPELPPLSLLLERTLAKYPGLAVYDARTRQAEGLVRVERGKYHPEIALFGTYSLYEDEYLANELSPEWLAGIGITLPLVDRSGRSGSLAAARASVRQVGLVREQARQDLAVAVEQTYRQARQALAEYDGLGSSLELAAENLRLREKAFDQGLSPSLDVVDSRLFLAGIESQRSAAAYAYVVALARLLALSGMEDEFGGYQRDHLLEVH
ncbi:TolC family protein [Desulfoprunum benzoelyticum]|uniref:Outer membrane protein TolC n=1 Tax=Desulfoprunum benzoelyticum TaxID=1506996 RepID=A0A840UTV3_9BACT|nr:TolC family protein [Desulfoprunum benzoelyticum]MBB5349627.1 outer membrane protein TolC [Desulfoprunum benzoelyticum]MBM9531608.1 TolC family protein [Desulfoprunum benzoelyticum]